MGVRLFLGILLISVSGCSTVFTVKTDPIQADVFVIDPKETKDAGKKSVGKTPLELPMSAVRDAAGDGVAPGQYFTVVIEKRGFHSEKLLVPASRFGTLVMAVEVKLRPDNGVREERIAQDLLARLFLAQKLARAKQYERAQIELEKILTEFPTFPRALSMRASIFYMQKNYAESLKWYEETLKVDPQMDDAIKMVATLRAAQKGGKP